MCARNARVSARPHDALAPKSERAPRSSDVDVDVLVIGGGVNGTGVARDAAMRGFRVALFERNDLAFGASGNSSGMIHGGVRYLTSAPEVTKASCTDSGYIQSIAPHLLFRIPFLVPVLRGRFSKALVPLMDGFFEAYDRYQPLKRGKPHARLTPDEVRVLEPGIVGDVVAGFSFDEWGIDGARLCTANAVDAIERGARVEVGVTVERLERDGPAWRVTLRDRHDGRVSRVRASAVVNASGAWAPITAALSGVTPARARVRPGKGIHVVFDRRLSNYAISGRAIDGRQIFLEPWQNVSVLGTTDDDYYGDLDRVRATSEEVRYLVEGMALLFPDVRKARAIGTYAGVRPTLYSFGPTEDALSRDHRIVDHAADGAPSLFTMIGGKLASYRIFAEEMVDLLCRRLGNEARSSTHRVSLPGGDAAVDPLALAEREGLEPIAAKRLVYRHGSRALALVERMRERPREASVVCACEPVLECEVRHAVKHELARTVSDVARRTRLGLGACGGVRCAARCGQLVADERGLPPEAGRRQALEFLLERAGARAVVLGPEQARQDAFGLAAVRSELGLLPERAPSDGEPA